MDTTTHLLLWKQKVLVANMAPHKLHVWVKLFTPQPRNFPPPKLWTFKTSYLSCHICHWSSRSRYLHSKVDTKHERNDGIPYMAARRGFDLPLEPSLYSFDSDGKGHHLTSNETSCLHITHLVTMDTSNRERESDGGDSSQKY